MNISGFLKEMHSRGGLLVCLSGEVSWVLAQGLRGADFTGQNTPKGCKVVGGC